MKCSPLVMLPLVVVTYVGFSLELLLTGSERYEVDGNYTMTCTSALHSMVHAYITVNGTTRLTKEDGEIESNAYVLAVTITGVGLEYDAAVFQCFVDGEKSNNITIHAALGPLPAPSLLPSPKPFPTPTTTMTNSYSNFSARLSRTVSTNTSAVSYSHSPTTVVDHAPADNAAIIAGAGAIVVIIFAIPIVLVCIFFRLKKRKTSLILSANTTNNAESIAIITEPFVAPNSLQTDYHSTVKVTDDAEVTEATTELMAPNSLQTDYHSTGKVTDDAEVTEATTELMAPNSLQTDYHSTGKVTDDAEVTEATTELMAPNSLQTDYHSTGKVTDDAEVTEATTELMAPNSLQTDYHSTGKVTDDAEVTEATTELMAPNSLQTDYHSTGKVTDDAEVTEATTELMAPNSLQTDYHSTGKVTDDAEVTEATTELMAPNSLQTDYHSTGKVTDDAEVTKATTELMALNSPQADASNDPEHIDTTANTEGKQQANQKVQSVQSISSDSSMIVGIKSGKNAVSNKEGTNPPVFVYLEPSTSAVPVSEDHDPANMVAEGEVGGKTGTIMGPSTFKPRRSDVPKSDCDRPGEMTFEKPVNDVSPASTASSTPSNDSGRQIQRTENGYGIFNTPLGEKEEQTSQ